MGLVTGVMEGFQTNTLQVKHIHQLWKEKGVAGPPFFRGTGDELVG